MKDKDRLEKELFRLEIIENVIKSGKDKDQVAFDSLRYTINKIWSKYSYYRINYDDAKDSLRNFRKLYKKYGIETKLLENYEFQQKSSKLIASKIKSHEILTNMVISSYTK